MTTDPHKTAETWGPRVRPHTMDEQLEDAARKYQDTLANRWAALELWLESELDAREAAARLDRELEAALEFLEKHHPRPARVDRLREERRAQELDGVMGAVTARENDLTALHTDGPEARVVVTKTLHPEPDAVRECRLELGRLGHTWEVPDEATAEDWEHIHHAMTAKGLELLQAEEPAGGPEAEPKGLERRPPSAIRGEPTIIHRIDALFQERGAGKAVTLDQLRRELHLTSPRRRSAVNTALLNLRREGVIERVGFCIYMATGRRRPRPYSKNGGRP